MENLQKDIYCVAFDCGNSSFRVVLGHYDGKKIDMDVVHQVENQTIEVNGVFYWDILYIFNELQKGLQEAFKACNKIDSVGVSTWGVDFGLVGQKGQMLANPMSYRNSFGEEQLNRLNEEEKKFLFYRTGIQNNRINSLYQLLGIKEHFPENYHMADKLLMIPDILVNMFTGEYKTEGSIISTTQILDTEKRAYSKEVLNRFKLNDQLFVPIAAHGEELGILKGSIAKTLNVNVCPFVCVPSHDTASAVVAVPTEEQGFIFISSGTWSLIGTELQKTVINEQVYRDNFANEVGAFNSITLLKNSTGMHILQKVKKEMERDGYKLSWDEIESLAKTYTGDIGLFDPNNTIFFNPRSMVEAIGKFINGQEGKQIGYQEVITSAYRSLAYSYRYAIEQIEEIVGCSKEKIYIVGGGSRNYYLNQMTSDLTGKAVSAGPEEATSLGNIATQLKYHNPSLNLTDMRKIIENSVEIKTFSPDRSMNKQEIEKNYKIFKSLIQY
ncbi:FGGY family carbohydrate kinase [Petroclostridium sp. X23]|uniref:rhamnulokinase n=1 Tax=Petroclostridium sp. X23 TaxID=3045146 RepID=UPI0024ACF75C|nr:FGGY family carbohydrate kinase [Petroclostridium sp. X23]WHH58065.1 FGGY family carbohydrate kinase [Petroclostridium sp. X23]